MNITIENLCFGYRQRQVLRDVNLRVKSGSICALMGENGAGKTTLLKCIDGILRPRSGRVRADDIDILTLNPRERARTIAYVPQNAQAGDSGLNVAETVLSGRVPFMRGRLKNEDRDIAAQVMEEMALTRYALRPLNQISGGERQRVFIARAMAQRPRIMLLDEPTNNLDMHFQQDVMERIRAMRSRQGMTIVTILHDLNLAIAYADQAVLLKDGAVFASGVPQNLLSAANIREVFRADVRFAALDGVKYVVPHRKEEAKP